MILGQGVEPPAIKVFVGCLTNTAWLDNHQPDFEQSVLRRCAWLPALARPEEGSEPQPRTTETELELVPRDS